MSDNLDTVWEIEPHTIAKHIILKNYLRAWFPILGRWNDRLLFIDGYAGPGVYDGNQEGSPIITLQEALKYLDYCDSIRLRRPEIVFLFIEQDKERFAVLERELSKLVLPKELIVHTVNSTFEEQSREILDFLDDKNAKLDPAFVFIDPFGYSLPFELIQRLMQHEKCEVFINFMYEFVNRFITRDGQHEVMTDLFGTNEWEAVDYSVLSPAERRTVIHDLYQSQLEKHAARYVRSFEMKGIRNTTKYFLYYGTNNKLGLQKMKDAMWKVNTGGSYSFSDKTYGQSVLFGDEPDYAFLKKLIVERFSGQTVTVDEIEDFVLCDTPFLITHYKRNVLKPMEQQTNEIQVLTTGRRAGTFKEGTVIKFLV